MNNDTIKVPRIFEDQLMKIRDLKLIKNEISDQVKSERKLEGSGT